MKLSRWRWCLFLCEYKEQRLYEQKMLWKWSLPPFALCVLRWRENHRVWNNLRVWKWLFTFRAWTTSVKLCVAVAELRVWLQTGLYNTGRVVVYRIRASTRERLYRVRLNASLMPDNSRPVSNTQICTSLMTRADRLILWAGGLLLQCSA